MAIWSDFYAQIASYIVKNKNISPLFSAQITNNEPRKIIG